MRYGVYDVVISLGSNQSEMRHFVDIIFAGFYIRSQVTLKKTGIYSYTLVLRKTNFYTNLVNKIKYITICCSTFCW